MPSQSWPRKARLDPSAFRKPMEQSSCDGVLVPQNIKTARSGPRERCPNTITVRRRHGGRGSLPRFVFPAYDSVGCNSFLLIETALVRSAPC
jgi:hypothetical protein